METMILKIGGENKMSLATQFLIEEHLKEIKRLKQENKELREKHKVACDYIEWCGRTITKLLEAEKELQEQLEFYEGQEELREWNREQYGDY